MSTKTTSEQYDLGSNYWRTILDASNDAIFIHDLREGILVGANRRAEEMYGYPKEQLIGKHIGVISSGLPPCTERDALRWVLKVRAGKPQILEWQARHADGTLFPVEVSVRSEEIDGRLMVVAAVRDISERKNAEKFHRAILNASNDTIFVHDAQTGAIIDCNTRAEEDFEISREKLASIDVGSLSLNEPPYTQAEALSWIQKARTEGPQRFEWKAKSISGHIFDTEVSMRAATIGEQELVIVTGRDITERKRAQKELAASANRCRTWLSDSTVCTKVLDLDFNLQYMSEAGVKALNIDDVTQLYGKPYPFSFFPDSFCKPMMNDLQKVKSTGKKLTQEGCVFDDNDKEIWFEATIIPVKDDQDIIEYFMVISVDITARKKAEHELVSSNMFLDSVIDQSPFPMFVVDLHGTIIRTNQAMCNTLDLTSEQLLDHYSIFKNTNLQGAALTEIKKTVFDHHGVAHFNAFWEMGLPGSPDESKKMTLDVKASMIPVLNHEGELIHVICQWLNISEQKKAKEALEESEQRFRSAIENSPIPIMMYADDGSVLYISRAWCQITGYSKEELSSIRAWADRAYGENGPAAEERIYRLFGLDKSINEGDITIRVKNGTQHIWNFSTAPLGTLPDGRRLLISMAMDVTQHRADEQQLKKHNSELEYFNKLAVGREMRMIELKKEINALCRKIGKPETYS